MKIKIVAADRHGMIAQLSVEMEEKETMTAFQKFGEYLTARVKRQMREEAQEAVEEEAIKGLVSAEEETPEDGGGVDTEEGEGREETEVLTYRGYMHLECPKCGKISSFYINKEQRGYICNHCGTYSRFATPLVPAWEYCKHCGLTKYMTNLTDMEFTKECRKCGKPLTLRWDEETETYKTVPEAKE
mgnify:CR=1 FL=1